MNYLRQGCLEDVEWSLRGAEQLQCPRFLLHWLQAGSAGKMAKHSTWHPIQKRSLLEATIVNDIQSCLAFFLSFLYSLGKLM